MNRCVLNETSNNVRPLILSNLLIIEEFRDNSRYVNIIMYKFNLIKFLPMYCIKIIFILYNILSFLIGTCDIVCFVYFYATLK